MQGFLDRQIVFNLFRKELYVFFREVCRGHFELKFLLTFRVEVRPRDDCVELSALQGPDFEVRSSLGVQFTKTAEDIGLNTHENDLLLLPLRKALNLGVEL